LLVKCLTINNVSDVAGFSEHHIDGMGFVLFVTFCGKSGVRSYYGNSWHFVLK